MRRRYISYMAVLLAAVFGYTLFVKPASVTVLKRADSPTGAISGRVLGADGQPIVYALVLAEKTDQTIQPTPRAWTNEQGEFLISDLAPGLYTIQTRKDEDGYPHSAFNLYDAGDPVETNVQVEPGSTAKRIVIHRTVKAASLEGLVVDEVTQAPVKNAQVTVRRVDKPDRFLTAGLNRLGTEGGFKVLVPSLPVTLKVSSLGYADWYYRESNQRGPGSLSLPSGTTRNIVVSLHRSSVKRSSK
jgi:hypothetical protein